MMTAGETSVMHARTHAKTGIGLALHAFVIWLACGLTVALGHEVLGSETTLRGYPEIQEANFRESAVTLL